jgi:hypothetical protein
VSGPAPLGPEHRCTVRGLAVVTTFHYIARHFGESSLDRIVGELGDEYADALDFDFMLAEQLDARLVFPVRLLVELMERVALRYSTEGGAPALAERIGTFAAYEAQPLLRRLVINLASPQVLVKKAAQLWSHYYSCGALVCEETGESSLRLTVSDFHDAHPLWCRRLTGYMRELLRRASGRQTRLSEVRCACQGAPCCEWTGDWSGSSLF